ncbi:MULTISPECIES: phospholipase D family protein [Pseudomonas]|uniref:PLD phosphodiesterase domain-containing protein n=1 Tax=Pseudomonas plecoglossicida TaxID=70775 RepID=A0ABX4TVH1_PSEDL|nr:MULTISPECIES: phospholipase D family protein [Pseudomonas]OAK53353.1 hypothetical protein A3K88_07765 [Pseudomonas putida]PPB16736.1 hypothetical protein HV87_19545 [Pseudomonas aeruginosa]MCL8332477.1 phospholipase D family protein [Pseudomonas juntendi]MDM1714223.1 hypothetical protein [Pseudomonas sp. 165]PLU85339.1 hypothetical protein CXG44_21240 [Pseudomonas plecoglossicida]
MFLGSREQILSAIKNLIQAPDADYGVAVAFWGNGSEALIPRQGAGRLICNLSHPGTNPYAVERIMAQPGIRMRQSSRLHAKVVVSNAGAIVGSANFSDAALGFEGQALGWTEAGVLLDPERDEYKQVLDWFRSTWEKAAEVAETDLATAKENWKARGLPEAPVPLPSVSTSESKPEVTIPEPSDRAPELYEEDIFEKKPFLRTSANQMRMVSDTLQGLFDESVLGIECGSRDTKPKDKERYASAHAAHILWTASGQISSTNIAGISVFRNPEDVAARSREMGTFDLVLSFIERLAHDTTLPVKPSIRYWAKIAHKQIRPQ